MQLIKIDANKDSFKTIEFNPSGPSYILAKQKNLDSAENGKTYNGVGKSLLIRIIHFCLGGNPKNYELFCKRLPDWTFILTIRVNGNDKILTRSTNLPNEILIDNEPKVVSKFNKQLEEWCFNIPNKIPYITYRSLISFFIRPKRESYNTCLKPTKVGKDYQSMLLNSFLLGLDINLATAKYKNKTKKTSISSLEKSFKKDILLRDFFSGDKDSSLAIKDLEDKIQKLEKDIKTYKVANDYYDVEKEKYELEEKLQNAKNEKTLLEANIRSINMGLKISPKMDHQKLESIYSEAKIVFPDNVTKTLEEVDIFYSSLITERKKRLLEQRNSISLRIGYFNKIIQRNQEMIESKLKYLGQHKALDIFVSVNNRCNELKNQKESLQKYEKIQGIYKKQIRQIDKDMLTETDITEAYLDEKEQETTKLLEFFRDLAKRIYPFKSAGLTIQNNDGDNQTRYNIHPRIESDASDGINNVEIFCYDLTLLFMGKNHNCDFVFHDSRIFNGVDERQKAEVLRIVHELFTIENKQYIATINQNQLNEISSVLTNEEYDEIVGSKIVKTLTDDEADGKLLGIEVDLGKE